MQVINRPTTEVIPTLTTRKPARGLSAQWEVVDGKLVCSWFKHPD